MSENHSLKLSIDANSAKAGSRDFVSAINAVKLAVRDLERDSAGAFTILSKVNTSGLKSIGTEARTAATGLSSTEAAASRMATSIQRTALASASALRTSSAEVERLKTRMAGLGDAAALDQLNSDLARLKANLTAARSILDVRQARSDFSDSAASIRQRANALGAQAAAEVQAANAARDHAASLETLAQKYNPLRANSMAYANALEEIQRAESAGVLSAKLAESARERAASTFLTAGRNAEVFAGQMRGSAHAAQQVGFQLNDIGVMLAGGMSPLAIATGQGTQLAQTFQTLGSRAEILSTLKAGFLSMVSPISLVTIGAIALGAGLYYGLSRAIPPTKTLKDALSELEDSLNRAKGSTELANNLDAIAAKYGNTTRAVLNLVEANRKLDMRKSREAVITARDSAYLETSNIDGWESLAGYADTVKGRAMAIKDQLGLSADEAARLEEIMRRLKDETDATALSTLASNARELIENAAGGIENLTTAQEVWVRGLADVEGKTREYLALDIAGPTAAAKAQTDSWLTSMSGVATQAQNILTSLKGLSGLKVNIALPALPTPTSAPARPTSAPGPVTAGGAGGGGGGGGGGRYTEATTADAIVAATLRRVDALKVEGATAESLTSTLQGRIQSLELERLTLETVAAGTYKTEEAAQLFAKAMIDSGSGVDATTLAMIRQVDAATLLNESLTRLSKDPVKEWMNSVPTWIEAGQQIEIGAIGHVKNALSEFIKTGKLDFESLGDAILGTVADIVADKAMAELANFLGRGDGQGLGGVLGGLFKSAGDPATGDAASMIAGSTTAGANISSAMVTAGQTVSQQIASAMTSAGTSAGASVRTGATTGLAVGSNNIRTASVTAGSTLGQGVVSGAQQGAPILASGVAGGAGGGGGGGGFLSSLGGFGGIASMLLGAFSEGGYSDSPVSMARVPLSAFAGAPHFAEGGVTSGAIPSLLHPNEAVVPLSRGRKIPVDLGDAAGGTIINAPQTFHITTPDADSFRRSQKQIMAEAGAQTSRAVRSNG